MGKDILLIGALDLPNVPQAGDTVKNQYLLDFFKKHFYSVNYIDTMYWRKNPFVIVKLILSLFFCNYKNVIISTSNATAYKLITFISKFKFNKKFYYFMIGGNMPILIKKGIYSVKPFKKLEKIIVEADMVSKYWLDVGILQTYRIYNFKPFKYKVSADFRPSGKIKFIFLSRLTELKGVFHILEAVRNINKLEKSVDFVVDFYGTIDESIKEKFLAEVDVLPNVEYKGFINLKDESNYAVISQYDAMLFPTMYETEGFPGVIADAAIAGVPVIAADWNYSEELIGNGIRGYIFKTGSVEELQNKMLYVINNRDSVADLRANCISRAQEYNIDNTLTEKMLFDIGLK